MSHSINKFNTFSTNTSQQLSYAHWCGAICWSTAILLEAIPLKKTVLSPSDSSTPNSSSGMGGGGSWVSPSSTVECWLALSYAALVQANMWRLKKITTLESVCMCVCVHAHMCECCGMCMEVRGQVTEISSLLSPCGSQKPNSGSQTCQ